VQASKPEADKLDGALDDTEGRFNRLFAFLVKLLRIFGFQCALHLDAPGFEDTAWGCGLGQWWLKVVGSMRLGLPDRHQGHDATIVRRPLHRWRSRYRPGPFAANQTACALQAWRASYGSERRIKALSG